MNSHIRTIISAAVTIIFLAVILSLLDVNQLLLSISSMKAGYFTIAVALIPIFVFLKIYRWHYLVRQKAPIRFMDSLRSYLAGNCVALLTPARAGELSRVLYLPVDNKGIFAGIVVVDKVFDLLSLLLLSCIGSTVLFGERTTVFLAIVFAGILLIIFNIGRLAGLIKNFGPLKSFKSLRSLSDTAVMDNRVILISFLITMLAFTVALAQCYFLVLSFESVGVGTIVFSFPLIILTNIIPVTISGIGVREGASILLLSRFGVTPSTAFNSAFLIFFTDSFIPGMLGAFFVHRMPGPKKSEGGSDAQH